MTASKTGNDIQSALESLVVKDCSSCRHHHKQTHDKYVGTVYDTLAELDDQTIYFCREPSVVAITKKEACIGPTPKADCPLWSAPAKVKMDADLARVLDRRDAESPFDDEEARERRWKK